MQRRKKGFSLIELLVAIAIIVILLSLLFPVAKKLRESSRRIVCQSNIRQCVAALLYAASNDGVLPDPRRAHASWNSTGYIDAFPADIGPLVYKIITAATGSDLALMCPNAEQAPVTIDLFPLGLRPGPYYDGTNLIFYRMSYVYLGGHKRPLDPTSPPWISPQRISTAQTVALWADWTSKSDYAPIPTLTFGMHGSNGFVNGSGQQEPITYGVRGGHVGYVDGSVQWRGVQELVGRKVYYGMPENGIGPSFISNPGFWAYW